MRDEWAYRNRMEPFKSESERKNPKDVSTKVTIPVKSPNGNEGTIVYLHKMHDGSEWATVRWDGSNTDRMRIKR